MGTIKAMVAADEEAKTALEAACDTFVQKVKSTNTEWRNDRGFLRAEHVLMLWKRGVVGSDDSLVIGLFQLFASRDVSLKRELSYAFTSIVADEHGNIDDHVAAMGRELSDAGLIAISEEDGTVCV